ncbi:MAG: pantoate--beta-alanine ligase [Pseudomonadota bacterium]|nr:pantoate--beta-alanine ligase [Pseudomonadota bacterium]
MSLTVIRSAEGLRRALAPHRDARKLIGLVPTMGALHDGHLSLVHRASRDCGIVVASLFVNPTQFGENEDFDAYPRDESRDLSLFDEYGVDFVYAPSVDEMYPDGFKITITVQGVTEGLCGAARPGHFDGVTTVVSKLFADCKPDAAYFGQKDYQQMKVIERMVSDLDLNIRIVGLPVVRERDGLALSSRNAYLSAAHRRVAPSMFGTMRAVAERLHSGIDLDAQSEWGQSALLDAGFDRVDYFEVRDAATMEKPREFGPGMRIFAAAWLGQTRLIDNISADFEPE